LIWTVGSHTYGIGFHNAGSVRQTLALDTALARGIKLVPPSREAPTASDCGKLWNRSANEANQRDVVEAGFRLAAAYGWTDKADDLGCGVIFWKDLNGEWAMYAATVPRLMASPDEWGVVRGERWGVGSPEGDIPSSSVARVESDGRITE
jgi:hypothetical protein